jgi:hypothetical protein
MRIYLTQTFIESGYVGLVSREIVMAEGGIGNGIVEARRLALEQLNKNLTDSNSMVWVVLNIKFEDRVHGHHSNGEFRSIVTGDGYSYT